MNTTIRMLLSLAFSTTMSVHAQITTLDYKGSVMHGTSTYLPTGFVSPTSPATLPSTPFNGFFTVSITVEGSIANSNLTLLSDSISVMGNDVSNILIMHEPLTNPDGGPDFCAAGGCIKLTSQNGIITGATVDLLNSPPKGPRSGVVIGPVGDSLNYLFATTNGTCQNFLQGPPPFTYTGPTVRDCSVDAMSTKPGRWKVESGVPEPATSSLLVVAIAGMAISIRRRSSRDRSGLRLSRFCTFLP